MFISQNTLYTYIYKDVLYRKKWSHNENFVSERKRSKADVIASTWLFKNRKSESDRRLLERTRIECERWNCGRVYIRWPFRFVLESLMCFWHQRVGTFVTATVLFFKHVVDYNDRTVTRIDRAIGFDRVLAIREARLNEARSDSRTRGDSPAVAAARYNLICRL